MKKMNFLKILMTLVLAFALNGAFAQYVPQDDANTWHAIDTVTVGFNVPYYVEPDLYFNSGWAGTATDPDVGGLVNSTFVWTAPAGGASTATDAGVGDNYIEYVFDDVNTRYTLSVQETANSCPGTAVPMFVDVVAEPTVTFSADAPGTIIGADLDVCVTDARLTDGVQAVFTGYNKFQLVWDLEIYTLAADLVTPSRYFTLAGVDNGAAASYAVEKTDVAGTQEVVDASTFDFTLPTLGFTTLNEAATPLVERSTVYVYRIRKTNDRISRKSYYLLNTTALATGWAWSDVTDETITITVNPAPVTGPIYHISNFWNN